MATQGSTFGGLSSCLTPIPVFMTEWSASTQGLCTTVTGQGLRWSSNSLYSPGWGSLPGTELDVPEEMHFLPGRSPPNAKLCPCRAVSTQRVHILQIHTQACVEKYCCVLAMCLLGPPSLLPSKQSQMRLTWTGHLKNNLLFITNNKSFANRKLPKCWCEAEDCKLRRDSVTMDSTQSQLRHLKGAFVPSQGSGSSTETPLPRDNLMSLQTLQEPSHEYTGCLLAEYQCSQHQLREGKMTKCSICFHPCKYPTPGRG